MGDPDFEAMMKRHAAGDRDPDLMGELTRRACLEFHDPWEQPSRVPSVVGPLRLLPIDAGPYDQDKPEKLDVGSLELFVAVHNRSRLKRKSWPFFVTYDYLADPEPERCPRILMESPDGRSLTCSFVRNVQCKAADLADVHGFCEIWSEGQDRVVARLVETPGPDHGGYSPGNVLVLNLGVTLAEENPAITLRAFDRILNELLAAVAAFWGQIRAQFDL